MIHVLHGRHTIQAIRGWSAGSTRRYHDLRKHLGTACEDIENLTFSYDLNDGATNPSGVPVAPN